MTLNDDERGDTYMRVTDGSVSAQFQALRLPMGAGLGGLVAQTGGAVRHRRLLRRRAVPRTPARSTPGSARRAWSRSSGVPLRLGSQVIGVLFAANRPPGRSPGRRWRCWSRWPRTPRSRSTTPGCCSETRAALDELSAAQHASIRAHSDVGGAGRAGARPDDLAGAARRRRRGRGRGGDRRAGRRAAGARRRRPAGWPRSATSASLDARRVAEAVAASRAEGRSVRRGDLLVAAVVAGAENLGALVLRPDDELVDADQRILERAALVTALLLLFRRTVAEAEGRVRGELLDDLIARPVRDPTRCATRARRLGVDLDAPHVVVAVGDDAIAGRAARQRALSWAPTLRRPRGGLAAARDGRVVLMLPGDATPGATRPRGRAGSWAGSLGRPVTAGAGGPSTGPAAVAAALPGGATGALTALVALGRGGRRARAPPSWASSGLLRRRPGPGRAPAFLGRTSARWSTTTPGGARRWSRRWRRTSAWAAAWPGPPRPCTSTSTR